MKMKITRKRIRKIIKEEMRRELPISYYSDDVIIHEGLLDWLGDLFGKLIGFFTGAADEGAKEYAGSVESSFGPSNLQKIAKKHGLDGLGSPGEFDWDDLDMSDKKHRLTFFDAWKSHIALFEEDKADLEKAAAIEDWTPKDDSDEAAKEWQEKNGDAAGAFWGVIGGIRYVCGFLGTDIGLKGGTKQASQLEAAEKSGNPGEAAQALIAGLEWIVSVFGQGVKDGSEHAQNIIDAIKGLGSTAMKVGQAIEASGKEQQKESLELRKMINHMILCERNDN